MNVNVYNDDDLLELIDVVRIAQKTWETMNNLMKIKINLMKFDWRSVDC